MINISTDWEHGSAEDIFVLFAYLISKVDKSMVIKSINRIEISDYCLEFALTSTTSNLTR